MAYFLYAGSACVALLVSFFLFLPDKKPQHFFSVLALSCLCYVLFLFGSYLTGVLAYVPVLYHSDITVTFLAAPSLYLFFMSLLNEGKRPVRHYWPLFVIPVLSAVGIPLSNIFGLFPQDHRAGYLDLLAVPALTVLNFFSDLGFTVYFSVALAGAYRLSRRKKISRPKEMRVLVVVLVLLLLNSLFLLSGYALRRETIFTVASVFYTIIVIVFGFVLFHTPGFIQGSFIREPADNALLKPDELSAVRDRLAALMETEKAYVDPELSLKSLARGAHVTPHQLSWFINTELGMGFAEYVNGFRLESVRKELLADTDKAILDIALDNGFGSKTTFNALFLGAYGISPRDYRRNYAG